MVKSLLVIGKGGQLGRSIQKIEQSHPELEISYAGREQLDLSSSTSIAGYFQQNGFDIIINAAAYTAVDQAESEQEQAEQVNYHAVAQLAEIAKKQDAQLIHVSTDYVFDGEHYKPYQPEDPTHPQSVYGVSKQQGEEAIQAIAPKGCVVRTSWLYSEFGSNFVKTMLRLGAEREQIGVVADQVGSPTYATDLAEGLLVLVKRGMDGTEQKSLLPIYHFANQGVASWYDLAEAVFDVADLSCRAVPITTEQYPTAAKRPYYSVLDTQAIQRKTGVEIAHWRNGLSRCVNSLSV